MKNKVISFTPSEYRGTIEKQIREWQEKNPQVNVVSTEITPGGFLRDERVTIIYNESDN